jgi:hypothetical protein
MGSVEEYYATNFLVTESNDPGPPGRDVSIEQHPSIQPGQEYIRLPEARLFMLLIKVLFQ